MLVLRDHVACMGKERNAGVLEEKTAGHTAIDGKVVLKWTLKQVGCENVDWVNLAQDRNQWQHAETQ